MAKQADLKNKLANKNSTNPTAYLKNLVYAPTVQQKFKEVLKEKAAHFLTSLISLVDSSPDLQKCNPMTIIASAMKAATLELPIDKNLGYAWIVPYKNVATFQIGYKGYIQLALRTGLYRSINVIEVYEGELRKWNRLTEELDIDEGARKSEHVIGYAGYFELTNGFIKRVYWSKEDIERHRKKFAKSDFGWENNYDAMAKKTVLRNMLSKWGILSIDMQRAYVNDIDDPEQTKEVIDVEWSEIIEEANVANSPEQQEIVFEQ